MARHVIAQSGAPTAAPEFVGQHYVNTDNGDHYLASGTSASADWGDPVGSGGGVSNQIAVFDKGTASAGSVNFDFTDGLLQTVTTDQNTTITFTDPPNLTDLWRLWILVFGDRRGGHTLTWPAGVNWNADKDSPETDVGEWTMFEILYLNGRYNGRKLTTDLLPA